MSSWPALDSFLLTDPLDVGCDEALTVLHLYVEMVAAGTPEEAASRYPGVAAHLAACAPCFDDHQGLLAAVTREDRA